MSSHVFPLLADPAKYDACELDLRALPARRKYWIGLYRDHMPGGVAHSIEVAIYDGVDPDEAAERGAACQAFCGK